MSQPTSSTLRQLLDLKLDGRLDERVAELQAEGKGFRLIARALVEETGVQVSGEILRRWYPTEQAS